MFLNGLGLTVATYPDAESFLEGEPPLAGDTIIVDLLLPGISGAKVIGWLQGLKDRRASSPSRASPSPPSRSRSRGSGRSRCSESR